MRTVFSSLWLALLSVTMTPAGAGPRVLTIEEWRADIDQAVEAVHRLHPMPFDAMRDLDLPSRANSLKDDVPDLGDTAIMFRIAELIATLGDGHSRLTLPRLHPDIGLRTAHADTPPPRDARLRLDRYPILLNAFDDGLYVTSARQSHDHLLGARLESIAGRPVPDVVEAIRPIIHRDNEAWLRRIVADRMTIPAILEHYGIIEGTEAEFRFRTADGDYREENIEPIAADAGAWHGVLDDLTAIPLRRRHPGRPYWYRVINDHDAVYVQFREAAHRSDDPPTQFVQRLLAEAGNRNIERMVLDLRDNHGGRGMWNQPFLKGLLGHPRFDRPGGLYVLIGPETFSAAVLLLSELEQHSQAIFVGQPTGASPDHYGDAHLVTLKNSGLTLRISTIFWKNWLAGEFRDAIHPHLPVPERFEDLAGARDPALEQALSHEFPSNPLAFFRRLLIEVGVNAAALHLGHMAMDPGIEADFAGGLAAMGENFLAEGDVAKARYVYLIADNYYPDDAAIVTGLGRALEASDEPEEAAERYRRALELDPDMRPAKQGLERLRNGHEEP